MSVPHRRRSLLTQEGTARQSSVRLVAFPHDDDCPIPPEYQDSPIVAQEHLPVAAEELSSAPPDPTAFTREGRARLVYEQLVDAGYLHQYSAPSTHTGEAVLLALQRFVNRDTLAQYQNGVHRSGPRRGQEDLIFLPGFQADSGRFVTKQDFRTEAGGHRFSCKCGLTNTPLLDLLQSAFCNGPDEHYQNSAAYIWYTVHASRQAKYGTQGREAPEWDPFPDGRQVVPRWNSERETDEERKIRRQIWSATAPIDRQLPASALRPDAWLPPCQVPTETALWTPEQQHTWEEMLAREQKERTARQAILLSETTLAHRRGQERCIPPWHGVVGPHIDEIYAPAIWPQKTVYSDTAATAGASSGMSRSTSQAAMLSSRTSEETLGRQALQHVGDNRLLPPNNDEVLFKTPAQGKRPLQIVDPATKAAAKAVADN